MQQHIHMPHAFQKYCQLTLAICVLYNLLKEGLANSLVVKLIFVFTS